MNTVSDVGVLREVATAVARDRVVDGVNPLIRPPTAVAALNFFAGGRGLGVTGTLLW